MLIRKVREISHKLPVAERTNTQVTGHSFCVICARFEVHLVRVIVAGVTVCYPLDYLTVFLRTNNGRRKLPQRSPTIITAFERGESPRNNYKNLEKRKTS